MALWTELQAHLAVDSFNIIDLNSVPAEMQRVLPHKCLQRIPVSQGFTQLTMTDGFDFSYLKWGDAEMHTLSGVLASCKHLKELHLFALPGGALAPWSSPTFLPPAKE